MGKLNESVGDDEASTAISRRDFPEKQLKTIHEMHLNASKMCWILISRVCSIVSEADLLMRRENLAELVRLNQQTLPSPWTVELMNFECHLSPRKPLGWHKSSLSTKSSRTTRHGSASTGWCVWFYLRRGNFGIFLSCSLAALSLLAMSGLVLKISYSVPSHSASGTMNWEAEKILHSKENSNYATNKSQAGNY